MKAIAVFCGSNNGADIAYKEGAIALGKELLKRDITLVYGGASIGLMGAIADTMLQGGGKVIGVMPKILFEREIAHPQLTEFYVVGTMHERKAKMADLSDGFIAMPGGPGTLEEFFEIYTWAQIGLHQKPFGLLNINNYYQPLLNVFDHMVTEKFLHEKYKKMTLVESNPQLLLEQLYRFEAPIVKTYN